MIELLYVIEVKKSGIWEPSPFAVFYDKRMAEKAVKYHVVCGEEAHISNWKREPEFRHLDGAQVAHNLNATRVSECAGCCSVPVKEDRHPFQRGPFEPMQCEQCGRGPYDMVHSPWLGTRKLRPAILPDGRIVFSSEPEPERRVKSAADYTPLEREACISRAIGGNRVSLEICASNRWHLGAHPTSNTACDYAGCWCTLLP